MFADNVFEFLGKDRTRLSKLRNKKGRVVICIINVYNLVWESTLGVKSDLPCNIKEEK